MRTKKDKPQPAPLAVTLRSALAQGWHTLDALEALAGRVPAARHRVHAALAELRAGGCALEERVTRGVAEVRLGPATLPAPVPDDHRADLAATVTDLAREAQEVGLPLSDGWAEALDSLGLSEEEAERMRPVWTSAQDAWRRERVEGEQASAAPSEPAPRLDAPAPPVDQAAPVEVVGGPVARATGPGSRCAECNRRRDLHHPADAHPFAPKPRGRPRVAAAPPSPPLDAAAPVGESAEPETSRGESDGFTPDTLDAIREVVETAPPSVRERVRARRVQVSAATPKPSRCRPPACHWDDIVEPSRVRGFQRPLCEVHRARVEGAGGTLAAGGLAGVLQ